MKKLFYCWLWYSIVNCGPYGQEELSRGIAAMLVEASKWNPIYLRQIYWQGIMKGYLMGNFI